MTGSLVFDKNGGELWFGDLTWLTKNPTQTGMGVEVHLPSASGTLITDNTYAAADATISSNYYNSIYYRTIQKCGNVKILHLALTTNTWSAVNTWTNIGTVPNSNYYPNRLVESGVVTSGMKYVNLHIDMNGNIAVCPRQATANNDLFCTILPYI